MDFLQLVYAPHPIFKKKAEPVAVVDEGIRTLIAQMFETLRVEHGVGLGANMVGILKRIAVIHMKQDGKTHRYAMINPEITERSKETQRVEEASLSFPGISAEIERPRAITVKYLDEQGQPQELHAEGFLATVIQHEVEYLDGVVFLDHLSKMNRDRLLKRMQKVLKMNPPHVHGAGCHH
jgi:peptide deformylase